MMLVLTAACASVIAVGTAAAAGNPWEALPPAAERNGGLCVEGPVGDAACDSGDVERANSAQLHSILEEVTDTTFFRLFRTDLSGECPFERLATTQGNGCSAAPDDSDLGGGGSCAVAEEEARALFATSTAREPHPVDKALSSAEQRAAEVSPSPQSCDDEHLPEFWLDLCPTSGAGADVGVGFGTGPGEVVNLKRNVESDTGYNGSHIWAAIYKENCFVRASGPEAMCFEERVLFRLLSGMHTSINIHVAMHRNMTADHGALAVYSWHFGGEKAERLRNLHFAFLVLLRALHKGADFVRDYDYASFTVPEPRGGDGAPESAASGLGMQADDSTRTAALVEHLLGTCSLRSCASVFAAFDERQLFHGVHPYEHTWWSLKRQFKGVFQNITAIANCVPCEKCRLHFQLQLTGLGTALKWLLLPPELIPAATNREELVALVNTLAKFSRAIAWATRLAEVALAKVAPSAGPLSPRQVAKGAASSDTSALDVDVLDSAVSVIARAYREGLVDERGERTLLRLALARDVVLTSIINHYGGDALRHLPVIVAHYTTGSEAQPQ